MKNGRLIVFLVLFLFLIVLGGFIYKREQQSRNWSNSDYQQMTLFLKRANQQDKITLKSYFPDPFHEKTEAYVNNQKLSQIMVDGILFQDYPLDIEGDKNQELVLQVMSGELINSLVYRYDGDRLIRIPVSTEKPPYYYGTVTHNAPLFKDEDGDGVMELFVYYAHGEPIAKRTVEVYKYTKGGFNLVRKYEEKMSEVYL